MANDKLFEFRYDTDQDVVAIDRILNVGDVSQPYSASGSEGNIAISHVFARNISKYTIFRPGLYIDHQDYESKTVTSKPDNLRLMRQSDANRNPFASVLIDTALSINKELNWEEEAQYFDEYKGIKSNPILFTPGQGGITLVNGLPCIAIKNEVSFWLRIKNSEDCGIVNKTIEDGKWGFIINITGDLYGTG